MNDIQFFQTRMVRQYYEVTMPELVREIQRLNGLLALVIEAKETEPQAKDSRNDRPGKD